MVKQILLSLVFFAFNWLHLLASDNIANGARSSGLANASVTLSDVWCTSNNQAGLAFIKNISAGVYFENRFSLNALSLKAASIAVPMKAGVFGISASTFGYQLYSESKLGLAFSKSFGAIISAGVQLNYLNTKIGGGYGNTGTPAIEMGIQAKITKELTLSSHLSNPTRAKLANYNDERIPTIMRLGCDYKFSEKIFLAIEAQKDVVFKPIFKFGIEYNPKKELYFRTGFSTNPAKSTFGFGLVLQKFKLDLSSSLDPVLGFTPHIGLIYDMN